ncbi:hypothetical protein CKAN_02633700 [Cinnamomum micranthum f. kanehirae]|uniref:Uncharacterized protein n=1 Tax=Cinnamomum micranthum f. kanehirae TaxID=337451 RepID=A0A3S3NKH8_9MAGN|nr:hypothetical protein CKAN_02633700 [Cinnamomum micranthum f. kanehirae]
MSLLEIITKSAADAESTVKTPSPYPIILNPDRIFPLLKPQIAEEEPLPIQRVQGWKISDLDSQIISLSHKFFKKLKRKLKNPNSLSRTEFLDLLNSFLDQNSEKTGLSIGISPSDHEFTRRAIEKVGFLINRDVAGLILDACVEIDLWEVVETLILNGVVAGEAALGLVEKMVERRRSDMLCLFVKHVVDIRSSDLLLILKYFLSPATDAGLPGVRKEWERQALSAIEKAAGEKKKSPLGTQAAVLLAAAYDGFSTQELCLHYLFGSENVDGLALSGAVAGLGGVEMLRLVRYLGKWLKKYERFPDAAPCKSAESLLGLEACRWVPTLEAVVRCLGVVLDEHFSYLVLNPNFQEELVQIEGVVRSLQLEAGLCSSVGYLIENLRLDAEIQ